MNSLCTMCCRYCWRRKPPSIPNFKFSIRLSHALILQRVKDTKPLQQIHAQIIVSNSSDNVFLCNRLLNQYASRGLTNESRRIFSQTPNKNLVSWTIFISALTKNRQFSEAIEVFKEMAVREIKPNAITIATVLPSFGKLGFLPMGKSVHCYWIRRNSGRNVYVETGLVDMYVKLGCISIARKVFDEMPVKNIVSWNAIIAGYCGEEALRMYNAMRREGFHGDHFTLMSLFHSNDLRITHQVHCVIVRNGYLNDEVMKTALMEMYVNCDCVDDAYCVFDEIEEKDSVTWTSMLKGLIKSGNWRRTVEHFSKMMGDGGVRVDYIALVTMLTGCSSIGALEQGRRVHGVVVKTGFNADLFVGSAVIDMYANCGTVQDAQKHFESMEEKDVVCWNALISGYGMMGKGQEAVEIFRKMGNWGLDPDESTLVSVLCACSHSSMVTQGLEIFHRMTVAPSMKHYGCVMDIFGRAGRVNDAYVFMKGMQSQPGFEVYGPLLNACRIHRKFELGDEICREVLELNPGDAGYYVLVSNVYALTGSWDCARMSRIVMKLNGLKKNPGMSWIEIRGEMFTFMASQTDHFYYREIKEFLSTLILGIRAVGYEPDVDSVFLDVSDEVKKDVLFHHSEKLAIAFGLMRTKPGSSIRITKNLRICKDCHLASKFISKVYGRVLTIKDAHRFHVFEDGMCSCGDQW